MCIYSCLSNNKKLKTWPQSHADNRKYFSGLSDVKSKGSTHVLLGEVRGKNLEMFLLRKDNVIMINEFRYGQTLKI